MQLNGASKPSGLSSRHLLGTLLVAAGCTAAASGGKAVVPSMPKPTEVAAPLPQRLRSRFEQWEVTSTSVVIAGIVQGGRLLWWQGRAPRSGEAPGRETPFRIGSLTKLFTAALVLELQERGVVDLDRPIEAYLPAAREIHYPTTDSARITLRNLLVHTSGLPSSAPGQGTDDPPPSRALGTVRLLFAPGADVEYANLGYELIGEIVGRVGGSSYPRLLEEKLLRPLGMTSTRFPLPGEGPVGGPAWTALGNKNSAGGLVSTLDDLVRFVSFELGAWPPRDGDETGPLPRRVVRASQLALGGQRTDRRVFGAGWILSELGGTRLVTLTGRVDGSSVTLALLPDRAVGAIVLATPTAASTEPLALGLLDLVAADLSEQAGTSDARFRSALQTVLQILSGVPPDSVSDRFAPGFFERVPGFLTVLSDIHARRGRCATVRSSSLRSAGAGEAIVSCDRGELSVSIELTADGRGQIARLMFR